MQLNSLVNWLVVLILIYVGRILELVPYLANFSIGKFAVILVLIFYVTSKKDGQLNQPIFSFPQGKYLAIVTVLAVLSIPGSVWQGKSFDFVFSFYSKLLIFVYLIVMIVSTEEHLKKLSWGLVLSCLALCITAVVNPMMVVGRLYVGGTYDPNDLALLLVMCLPIIFYLWEKESGSIKHLLLVTMLLSLYIVPKTGSRGGLLALVAVIVAILLKKGIRYFFKGVLVVAVVAAMFYCVGGGQLERFSTISDLDDDYNQSAQEGRVQIWKRTSKLMLDNPLFGSGVGAFVQAEGQTHEGGKWSSAHNSFIQIGVESGLIALAAHIWALWKMISQARQRPGWLSSGLEVGLYAYVVGGMFLSWAYAYVFYLFIGLSLAQARIESPQTTTVETI